MCVCLACVVCACTFYVSVMGILCSSKLTHTLRLSLQRGRMEAMEKQIASLTGLVQSVLTKAPDSDST